MTAAAVVFVGAWALLHTGFYSHGQLIDTPTYESYATHVRNGDLPYRDFAVEYPPGAFAAFLPPAFVGDYRETFGWLMAAFGVCCVVLVALGGARAWGVAFVAVSPVLVGSLAFSRYDFWPAALTAAAVVALLRDRHTAGWVALALAVAAKLYPAVLVPLAIAWTWRRRGTSELARAGAVAALALLEVFVVFLLLAPHGLWESVRGQLSRPLQIESLAASALTTFGSPTMVSGSGSQNLAGHGTVAALSALTAAVVLLALWLAFAHGPSEPQRLARYAAACVCAFVAFGKVLSPQYLLWLVPLVPLVRGRRGLAATAILAAALLATQVWFPKRYWSYALEFHLAWVVLARNLLLVALLLVLSLPPLGRPRSG